MKIMDVGLLKKHGTEAGNCGVHVIFSSQFSRTRIFRGKNTVENIELLFFDRLKSAGSLKEIVPSITNYAVIQHNTTT